MNSFEADKQGNEEMSKQWSMHDPDPFVGTLPLEPGTVDAVIYASSKDHSGFARWMSPTSPIDMFGNPTVFSDKRKDSFAKDDDF